MARIELPYTEPVVRTKRQSRAFIRDVLMPAADILANCSFRKSGIYKVGNTQSISLSEMPCDWVEIGFDAIHLQPDENPREIQFNLWAHTATDTAHIPMPEAAVSVTAGEERSHFIGGVLLEPASPDADDDDDDDEDDGYDGSFEDIVIEQRDFYLNTVTQQPVRHLDYSFARDGNVVWQESHSLPVFPHWLGDTMEEQRSLDRVETSLYSEFDALDIQLIAGILDRLRLLRP